MRWSIHPSFFSIFLPSLSCSASSLHYRLSSNLFLPYRSSWSSLLLPCLLSSFALLAPLSPRYVQAYIYIYAYIRILPFDTFSLPRRSVAPCPVTALIPTPGCLARDSAGPGIASFDWRAQLRSVISHRRMGDAHATGRARTCRFVRNVSVVDACDRRRVLWSL